MGPDDALNLAPVPVLLIDQTFGYHDLLVRERAAVALDRIRRAGATTLLVSHEEELIRRLADEVWWLHQGKLAGRGDPEEMLAAYRKHVADQTSRLGREHHAARWRPRVRRGDGRAEIVRVETIGESGKPTMVWRSGERAVVRVRGALPRCGGRSGGGHHDPHAHRAECLRHQYGTGAAETRALQRRRICWNWPSRSGANYARASTRSPWRRTIPMASGTIGWRTPSRSRSATTRYTAGVANLRAQVSLLDAARPHRRRR